MVARMEEESDSISEMSLNFCCSESKETTIAHYNQAGLKSI